jgi:hypothetical protein
MKGKSSIHSRVSKKNVFVAGKSATCSHFEKGRAKYKENRRPNLQKIRSIRIVDSHGYFDKRVNDRSFPFHLQMFVPQ